MATRPYDDQTNIIELAEFRGDRAQLEVQEVVHNRTTEITAGEHYAAQAIRVSYGVEPLVYDESAARPSVAKVEVTEAPKLPANPVTVEVGPVAQVSTSEITPATLATNPVAEATPVNDEARAREAILQAIGDAGDQQVELPGAA